jgi:hypothetical protein
VWSSGRAGPGGGGAGREGGGSCGGGRDARVGGEGQVAGEVRGQMAK